MSRFVKNYGKVVAIIGEAEKGEVLNPVYIMDEPHAVSEFLEGELLSAYRDAVKTGAEDIYLIRVNYNTDREKFKQYKEAYSILESFNVDIIVPLDFTLSEYIVDYPEIFLRKQQYETDGSKRFFETDDRIEKIEYIKIDDTKIKDYTFGFDGFTLDKVFEAGHTITIYYFAFPKMDIDYTVYAVRNNNIVSKKEMTFNFDITDGKEQKTEIEVEKLFNLNGDIKYFIRNEIPYIDIYTPSTGRDYIYFVFNKEDFINNNTNYKYYTEELAKYCSMLDSVAVVKPDKNNNLKNQINKMKDILNSDNNFGKYIVSTSSEVKYFSGIKSAQVGLSSLISSYDSHMSITNKNLQNIQLINKDIMSDIKLLSDYGYTSFYESIRNGVVPFKAITLANNDSNYRSLRVVRVVNELSKRIKEKCDDYIGGGITVALNKLPGDINSVVDELKEENKIHKAKHSIDKLNNTKIKVELEVWIQGEITSINTSLTADIV